MYFDLRRESVGILYMKRLRYTNMKEFNTPAARTAVSCSLGLCVLIALSLSGGGLFRGTRQLQPIDGDSFVDKLGDLTTYADRVEVI